MLLTADDGSELELKLLGYESPHARGASDDWLVLFIRMKVGSETWEARDPALVWEEARDLSNWLDGIEKADPSAGWSIDFTEPVLRFEAFRRTPDTIVLRVYCQRFPKPAPGEHFSKIFQLNREELRRGAEELRSELRSFPSRFPVDESANESD